jgi:hypothetical protein
MTIKLKNSSFQDHQKNFLSYLRINIVVAYFRPHFMQEKFLLHNKQLIPCCFNMTQDIATTITSTITPKWKILPLLLKNKHYYNLLYTSFHVGRILITQQKTCTLFFQHDKRHSNNNYIKIVLPPNITSDHFARSMSLKTKCKPKFEMYLKSSHFPKHST